MPSRRLQRSKRTTPDLRASGKNAHPARMLGRIPRDIEMLSPIVRVSLGLTDSTLFNYPTITRTIVLGNPYYRVNDLLIDLRQTFNDCFQLSFGKIVGALNF